MIRLPLALDKPTMGTGTCAGTFAGTGMGTKLEPVYVEAAAGRTNIETGVMFGTADIGTTEAGIERGTTGTGIERVGIGTTETWFGNMGVGTRTTVATTEVPGIVTEPGGGAVAMLQSVES